jgi:hypothetical protein
MPEGRILSEEDTELAEQRTLEMRKLTHERKELIKKVDAFNRANPKNPACPACIFKDFLFESPYTNARENKFTGNLEDYQHMKPLGEARTVIQRRHGVDIVYGKCLDFECTKDPRHHISIEFSEKEAKDKKVE